MIGALFSKMGRLGSAFRAGGAATDINKKSIGGFLGKQFGGSSIGRRAGTAAGFYLAGQATTGYIDTFAQELEGYYGTERYERKFGTAAETVSGAVGFYFNLQAAMGLLGRDPITRMGNSMRYGGAKGRLAGAERSFAEHPGRRGITGQGNRVDPKYGMASPVGPGRELQSARGAMAAARDVPRMGYRGILTGAAMGAAAAGVGDGFGVLSAAVLGSTLDIMLPIMKFGGKAVGTRKDIARTREFGMRGASNVKEGAFIAKRLGMTAGIMGGGALVGGAIAATNNNNLQEGNIIDFRKGNDQGVNRMNFSTAGLVQALHKNNRRY
jgi:hypothetical protein